MTYRDLENLTITEILLQPFGIRTEPGLGQIEDMEEFIDRNWPPGHELKPTTYFMLGVMLAKAIMHDLPEVTWAGEPDAEIGSLDEVAIKTKMKNGTEFQFKPCTRIMKFLKDREDAPRAAYYMIEHFTHYDVFSDEYKEKFVGEDGWVKLSNGTRFRSITFDKTPGKDL